MSIVCTGVGSIYFDEENRVVIELAWIVAVMDQQACGKNDDRVVRADRAGNLLEEGSH